MISFDKTIKQYGETRHIYEPVSFRVEVVESDSDYRDYDRQARVMLGDIVVYTDDAILYNEDEKKRYDKTMHAEKTFEDFAHKLAVLVTIKWPS